MAGWISQSRIVLDAQNQDRRRSVDLLSIFGHKRSSKDHQCGDYTAPTRTNTAATRNQHGNHKHVIVSGDCSIAKCRRRRD
ncbi:hypothetical protein DPMN_168527 [Dreissena polymorpha]|uniref:Uncharacterized protein n=1 Tax=Dreissena polymorpha TaxID=45954 RepID=A0A9D4F0T8_DREPO|nr:hypothetical protein DPMN_168527 [Dreissena polymorpha]